ncbi:MAG: mannose-1-phosphate guanylyltransferase/mannose-6-phosphate isomerase [Desulfobacterales bacterium]|jgi:mannose-1-phosphate guanylyltransferase/mannose-6-phosphate isomerase
MVVPVILAGGAGTRLWPLSRELHPKQVLKLSGAQTMFQNSLARLAGLEALAPPIVVCNENHRFMIAEQLREQGILADAIILEPMGKNTAPAIAVAALQACRQGDDPVLLVLPADHHIGRPDIFRRQVTEASPLARAGRLVTFGIVPTAPETGYGYIAQGALLPPCAQERAYAIEAFVEKPDRATAEAYLSSGNYLWNSGMFLFRASVLLAEMRRLVPAMVSACEKALAEGREDLDFYRLDQAAFAACPADSIDYAVMEKTSLGAMLPLDAAWSDLGSWEALWDVGSKDAHANVTQGDTLLHDVTRSVVHAGHRLVAAVGVDRHIIVETADAVFVCPRARAQDVKHLVNRLKDERRPETERHRQVYRPWGTVDSIIAAERFQVKRVIVRPKARIALQQHNHRAEHWVVVKGTALVQRGEETFLLQEDASTYIPVGTAHRLANPGKIPLEIIEVRTGSYLEEDDVTRLEDDYGR